VLAGYDEKTLGAVPAWTICFLLLAAMMLVLGRYHSWSLPPARNTVNGEATVGAVARMLWEVIVEYFKKPGIWVSILFIILLRAGEAQVQSIGPLFLPEARHPGPDQPSACKASSRATTAGRR
jgi:PAT family beta-lactamase induction signal transducer AmpG